MENINDVYNYCGLLANKTQSGYFTPDDFNLAAPIGQLNFLRVKIGLPEAYQPLAPYPPQSYQLTQVISDSLRPFIKEVTLNKVGQGFDIPTDSVAYSTSGYQYVENTSCGQAPIFSEEPIEFVTDGERRQRLNSFLTPPSYEYPIGAYLNGQLVVYPKDITSINLTYIKMPNKPIRNYTINSNDQDIYEPIGSVQLEFPKMDWEAISLYIVKAYAINMRETELLNYIEGKIRTGQ